jgi:hypothetical protein
VTQVSSANIAAVYELGDWKVVVRLPAGAEIIVLPSHSDRLRGPPSLLLNGYRGEGVKRLVP